MAEVQECDNNPKCSLPKQFETHIRLSDKDLKDRDDYRKKQDEMYIAIKGNPSLGVKGLVQHIDEQGKDLKNMKEKLDKDHELLWWNRKVDDIWKIIKIPIFTLITFAIIAALLGFSAYDYVLKYLKIK